VPVTVVPLCSSVAGPPGLGPVEATPASYRQDPDTSHELHCPARAGADNPASALDEMHTHAKTSTHLHRPDLTTVRRPSVGCEQLIVRATTRSVRDPFAPKKATTPRTSNAMTFPPRFKLSTLRKARRVCRKGLSPPQSAVKGSRNRTGNELSTSAVARRTDWRALRCGRYVRIHDTLP
jgi:hypothetical protein